MISEWDWQRLGNNCLKIGSGSTPTGGKDTYLGSGPYSLIRSQNIHNDGFKPLGLAFINLEQAKKLEGVSVEAGDVLLNITGDSVARVCLVPSKYLPARVNQHVAIIRPIDSIFDSRFVRYFLASSYQQDLMLGMAAAGATRNALTKAMIEDFKIPCPPIDIQRGIADTLSEIDDCITALRESSTTLEAMAQAIFKSWFIDFDPVHAKMEGRIPEGMDETTASLFPNSFEESEMGLIPRGWKVCQFEKFISRISVGKKFDQKSAIVLGKVPILDQGRSGIIGFHNEKPSVIANLENPVVVFANHTCYMRLISYDFSAIQNVLPFVGKDVDTVWAYFATRNKVKLSEYKGHWPEFAVQKAILPISNLTNCFRDTVNSMVSCIHFNELEAKSLEALRDTLLPRLISGQLRIPDFAESSLN